MTFTADFDVRGIPKGQARPRAFARKTKDGKAVARVYDPGTAEKWKGDIVRAGEKWRPINPITSAVSVSLIFWMPRPKRLLRQKDSEGALFHEGKPDLDNLVKAVLDALTTDGWWRDDAQVSKVNATKMYHAKEGSPGAQITISELDHLPFD